MTLEYIEQYLQPKLNHNYEKYRSAHPLQKGKYELACKKILAEIEAIHSFAKWTGKPFIPRAHKIKNASSQK